MSMTLEQVIADCEEEISDCQIDLDGIAKLLEEYPERKEAFARDIDDYKKRMDYNHQLAEWLKELQERRKSDNEIPFGNASFSELDSIINAYEMHGNHKKVVELLKELRERRERSEIAKPTGESAQIVPNEDLISRKSAIDAVRDSYDEILDFTSTGRTISDSVEDIISDLPSAQPDIIRCKDCKHKGTKNCVANAWTTIFGFGVKDDFYCGLAARRTNE